MVRHDVYQSFKHLALNTPALAASCNFSISTLPKPYCHDLQGVRAILLGADPTNNGTKAKKGPLALEYVFGLNSPYEKDFFRPQLTNLKAIGLPKEGIYIQNVCRNYFLEETSKNKTWEIAARLWLPFLKEELDILPKDIPVLVTAERIARLLVTDLPKAKDIYGGTKQLPLFSEFLARQVIPFYRHPAYSLSTKWPAYREFVKDSISVKNV